MYIEKTGFYMHDKKTKRKVDFKKIFSFSWKNFGVMVLILCAAAAICFALKPLSEADSHGPLIFLLAILLISLYTEGYFYGIFSSMVSVFAVNIIFTYPYFKMNFTLTGYPLTFICMFATSIIACTMSTRAKEAEEIKVKAEREGMRANLLRSISHDFRTPLTSIIGTLDLLENEDGSVTAEEKKHLVADAKSEAEWLINMVENLLSITRFGEDAKTNIHKEPQLAEEIIAASVEHFRKQYPDIKVKIKIPTEIVFVDADAILIEQVLNNLMINSALHGEKTSEVTVSVYTKGKSAYFEVADDGKGFTKEELKHIFDEYVSREYVGRTKTMRGMGIGLSVCNTIIKAHDGVMKASNRPSGGACVAFNLPISEVEDEL